jgi:hypothetical protein
VRRAFWERGTHGARLLGALLVFAAFVAIDLTSIARHLPTKVSGDEWRYLFYAKNLLSGYFSPPERVFLWNGPGYPLFIAPFVKADFADGARYANAFLHAGTLAYAWLILRTRLSALWTYSAVVLLGFHPQARDHLHLLYTETLCAFLLTAWTFHTLRATTDVALVRASGWHRVHVVLAGIFLGLLCLTKVAFGPATAAFLVLLFLVGRRFRARRSASGGVRASPLLTAHLQAALIALALCVPYLVYTHSLTGRIFYWASAWPNPFYWLTSPFPEESGDWYHQGWVFNNPLLREHHGAIFLRTSGLDKNPNLPEIEQLLNLSSPESADIFLQQALANVREHPLKFLSNWSVNWLRLFFDVPVSVRGTPFWNDATQANLPLLLFTAFVVVRARQTRTGLPRHFYPLTGLVLLNLASYSLASIVARYLVPLVPFWWIVACSVLSRSARRARRAERPARAGKRRGPPRSALARAASPEK